MEFLSCLGMHTHILCSMLFTPVWDLLSVVDGETNLSVHLAMFERNTSTRLQNTVCIQPAAHQFNQRVRSTKQETSLL